MISLDTSLLAAIFFREANAGALVGWMESVREQKLMMSAWTLIEMASVGGIERRLCEAADLLGIGRVDVA